MKIDYKILRGSVLSNYSDKTKEKLKSLDVLNQEVQAQINSLSVQDIDNIEKEMNTGIILNHPCFKLMNKLQELDEDNTIITYNIILIDDPDFYYTFAYSFALYDINYDVKMISAIILGNRYNK